MAVGKQIDGEFNNTTLERDCDAHRQVDPAIINILREHRVKFTLFRQGSFIAKVTRSF
jgi:hypothetical protein